jgi:16S rRNA (cytidine1402-2'-O)-methyltransferase
MSTLYVVATPIGNLEDVTLRALRCLREVKLIIAEDTRKTKRLLTTYDIKTPMTSYHEYSRQAKLDYLLRQLEDGDAALVSEAGTPGISDPGYDLIVAASARGIAVVPIPGPSAVISALVISGLPTDRFSYLGFLPHRAGERRRRLESIAGEKGTIVALESPHRLLAALKDIQAVLGDRRIAVCRELTKIHEEVFRGRLSQAIAHFTEPRGEFALVVEGKREADKPQLTEDIARKLQEMRRSGIPAKEAMAQVARDTGLAKRELYRAWLKKA